jgi:hypothetical protein
MKMKKNSKNESRFSNEKSSGLMTLTPSRFRSRS